MLTINKPVPMETVVWRKNETFAGIESEKVNQAWDSLLPRKSADLGEESNEHPIKT